MNHYHYQNYPGNGQPQRKKKKAKQTAPFSPTFHFKEFKVGSLENASTINIGNNYPTNFKGFKRQNQGLGTIDGNNNDIHDLQSYIHLRYFLDAFMDDHDDVPDYIKEMLDKYLEQEFKEPDKPEDESELDLESEREEE